ncbi:MAG: hypothetical protein GX781_03860 [Clostridiales bacterium]|nr:hypothetical protein [Clostridiales bacterium]
MREIFAQIPSSIVDAVVYTTILLVFLAGLFKCIFPYRKGAYLFRRAIRSLELMVNKEGTRPVWQEANFIGKPMQENWKHFLHNAQHLDLRGLGCSVDDYINEDDIFDKYAHLQLAETIPGLLTSLGILGTFIGLMRGLGNLDITSADSTMQGISSMIAGMTFAYGTSIAGIAASLLFSILFRAAQGSALSAMDDFTFSFSELVMQRPIDDNVYQKAHLEDQEAFLSRSATELNRSLTDGVGHAIEQAFVPISQSMSNFITAQTQSQMEGLDNIVSHFIAQMNSSLSGQLHQLGKTMSLINQAQTVSHESITHTMSAAESLMATIGSTQTVTREVIERFEGYIAGLDRSQSSNLHLAESMSSMLADMHANMEQQSIGYQTLLSGQSDMESQMQQYAQWSGRVLEAVDKQSASMMERNHEVSNQMAASSKLLSGSYTSFVENISTGLARTMGMFEENMHDMMKELGRQLSEYSQSQPKGTKGEVELAGFTRMQQAMTEMTAALNKALIALEQKAAQEA